MAVDISGIKTAIKSVLDTANTATAAYDLSEGMSRRVQNVCKFNIEKIFPQGNELPAVFVWTLAKKPQQVTINQTQAQGKRKGEVSFTVAGVVWVPYSTDYTEDPADDDCEKLMENIEEVLRNTDTISGTVKWHIPDGVTYHSSPSDEEAHLRIGLMSLQATVYY